MNVHNRLLIFIQQFVHAIQFRQNERLRLGWKSKMKCLFNHSHHLGIEHFHCGREHAERDDLGLCVLTSPHETTTDEALNPFGGASAWSVHWNSDPAIAGGGVLVDNGSRSDWTTTAERRLP